MIYGILMGSQGTGGDKFKECIRVRTITRDGIRKFTLLLKSFRQKAQHMVAGARKKLAHELCYPPRGQHQLRPQTMAY